MKAYTLQMTSTPNVAENLKFVEDSLLSKQSDIKGQLVVLPECFACFGGRENANIDLAERLWSSNSGNQAVDAEEAETPVQNALSQLAAKFGIYLVAGTFPIIDEESGKVKPMSLVYSPDGDLISSYQKIHLFDVDVGDNTGSYRESDTWQAGNQVSYFDTPWGRIGLAICYDVRFPALFQKLAELGCHAIVLPSAFTEKTGQAHWQVLVQARAIENQVFMIASNQSGTHTNQRQTFGHSILVDPWGDIISAANTELGLFGAEMPIEKLQQVRQAMPLQQHNRFSVELKSKDQD